MAAATITSMQLAATSLPSQIYLLSAVRATYSRSRSKSKDYYNCGTRYIFQKYTFHDSKLMTSTLYTYLNYRIHLIISRSQISWEMGMWAFEDILITLAYPDYHLDLRENSLYRHDTPMYTPWSDITLAGNLSSSATEPYRYLHSKRSPHQVQGICSKKEIWVF